MLKFVQNSVKCISDKSVLLQDSMDSIQEGRTPVNILKVEPHTVGTPDGEKMIIQIPALKPRCHGPPRGAGGEGHQLSNVTLKLRPSSAFGSLDQMNAAQKHSTAAEYSAVSDNTPSGIIARGTYLLQPVVSLS